jgi:23S rRNA (cytosine1962-C5)-methyltransferase
MQALLDAIATMPLPTDAQRIFHGRGGLHPGCEQWTLDAFPPVWLVTSFARPRRPSWPAARGPVGTLGAAQPGRSLNWVFQYRHEARAETRLMAGSVPEPHVVTEDGAGFRVHLLRGLNHGFFLDMAEGRRWVRELGRPARAQGAQPVRLHLCVLGGGLLAGARQVTNVDMSDGALAIGKRNHLHNGLRRRQLPPHDIFSSWGKITRSGPYDLVVLDPPSYQKGSFIAEKDYARLMRRLPDLVAPGGHALLCLNSPSSASPFCRTRCESRRRAFTSCSGCPTRRRLPMCRTSER